MLQPVGELVKVVHPLAAAHLQFKSAAVIEYACPAVMQAVRQLATDWEPSQPPTLGEQSMLVAMVTQAPAGGDGGGNGTGGGGDGGGGNGGGGEKMRM